MAYRWLAGFALGGVLLASDGRTSEYIISTIAGPGKPGLRTFAGDGGPAELAQLNDPWDVAVNEAGDVFIADRSNNRIRKVSKGVITTVAGGGTGAIGDGGLATSAVLRTPVGVALDAVGDLYIADQGNGRIRKVSGGVITTVAGGGTDTAGEGIPATRAWMAPVAIAIDGEKNLYVADGANRIRRISPDGMIRTVAGVFNRYNATSSGDGGPAKQANVQNPSSLAASHSGELFVAEERRVRRISRDGIITTIYAATTYASPRNISLDEAGNLFISEHTAISKLTPDGKTLTIIQGQGTGYSGDGGLANMANLVTVGGTTVDHAGNLFLADAEQNAVRVLRPVPAMALKPGYWEITERFATPFQPQADAFRQMRASADKLPANQRAAYIASVNAAEKNALAQSARGTEVKRGVCILSDAPLKSMLFEVSNEGTCALNTQVTAKAISVDSTCKSGDRVTKQTASVNRVESTSVKGISHSSVTDSGKNAVESDRTFTGAWARESCAPGAR